MITFLVESGTALEGALAYRSRDQSFDFEPSDPRVAEAAGTGLELMFGSLALVLDRTSGRLVQVWGYHPEAGWRSGPLEAPAAVPGIVRGELPVPLPPVGVAERLTPASELTTSRDPGSGWVHVSAGPAGDRLVGVAAGWLVELDGERLVGLWLRPETR